MAEQEEPVSCEIPFVVIFGTLAQYRAANVVHRFHKDGFLHYTGGGTRWLENDDIVRHWVDGGLVFSMHFRPTWKPFLSHLETLTEDKLEL